jgi:hypothetical protein
LLTKAVLTTTLSIIGGKIANPTATKKRFQVNARRSSNPNVAFAPRIQ